jgi:carboxylate-amine ligase
MELSPQKAEDHRFGASPPLSIGVEEELLLVDGALRLSARGEQVLGEIDPAVRDRVSTEIFATQIELKTGICHDAQEATEDLTRVRAAIRATGVELLGSGLHPDDDEQHPALVEKPRYEVVQKDFASLLKTPPCGLHVHVGMPDPETAVRVGNALRYHLPLLQALTANSPFRQGEDSGLASARTAVVRSYPRFEMPRAFRDYEDFRRVADQLIAAAGVDDYTYLWWAVRPHPRLGTVEVRAMDVQARAEANAAIAAFVQALAAKEIDQAATPELCREALEESYYQASRYGLEARLMVDDEVAAPAGEVAERVLAEVRPYARQLGGEDALDEIERIVREGNGADDQRRVHQCAGMGGLLGWLVKRSGAS